MQNSQANTKKIFTKFFWRAGKVKLFSKNEMRKLDIFQVASNVSLVAEAGCGRRA